MFQIKPNYVTDNSNKRVAVQLSIKAYEKIEEVLENYGLYHLMSEDTGEVLEVNEAKEYYRKLKKKK